MADRYSTALEIQSLVTNGLAESRDLEFKSELPGNSSGERKEFLADVSAFANSIGGNIIYGVREEGGVAKEVCGVSGLDDRAILRLEQYILTGISPRLVVRLVPVDCAGGRRVLLLSIPRSWARPHMVTLEGSNKFHARGASGKFPMDVSQLRVAFSEAEVAGKRIRDFRLDRLARVEIGDTPYPVTAGPKVILHMVPLGEDPTHPRFDLTGLENSGDLDPIYGQRWGTRINFDGLLSFENEAARNDAYLQVFRSGAVEGVSSSLFKNMDKNLLPSLAFEDSVIRAMTRWLRIQREIGAECPVVLMLSLLGVKGWSMAAPSGYLFSGHTPIDRDDLLIPEALVESWETDPATFLKPLFDSVWQAAAWPGSPYYDDKGLWKPANKNRTSQ